MMRLCMHRDGIVGSVSRCCLQALVFVNDIGGQFRIRIGARDSFACVTDNQIWGPSDNEKGNHLTFC